MFIFPSTYIASIPPTFTYNANTVSSSDLTTYTFSAVDIGTASATRLVVVSGYATNDNNAYTLSSATIDGGAATITQQVLHNGTTDGVGFIIQRTVTTGTTADVALTFTGTQNRCGIASYSLFDLSSTTAADTATSTTDGGSIAVNTSVDSIVVAVSGQVGGSTTTWTGVTENFDDVAIEGSVVFTGGSVQASSAETPRAVDATWGSGDFHANVAASWR